MHIRYIDPISYLGNLDLDLWRIRNMDPHPEPGVKHLNSSLILIKKVKLKNLQRKIFLHIKDDVTYGAFLQYDDEAF
jgi:hypothetical protein